MVSEFQAISLELEEAVSRGGGGDQYEGPGGSIAGLGDRKGRGELGVSLGGAGLLGGDETASLVRGLARGMAGRLVDEVELPELFEAGQGGPGDALLAGVAKASLKAGPGVKSCQGRSLGEMAERDEAYETEEIRSLHLVDVIRESLIVGSVHLQVMEDRDQGCTLPC